MRCGLPIATKDREGGLGEAPWGVARFSSGCQRKFRLSNRDWICRNFLFEGCSAMLLH